jgi:hypothetical protein
LVLIRNVRGRKEAGPIIRGVKSQVAQLGIFCYDMSFVQYQAEEEKMPEIVETVVSPEIFQFSAKWTLSDLVGGNTGLENEFLCKSCPGVICRAYASIASTAINPSSCQDAVEKIGDPMRQTYRKEGRSETLQLSHVN